LKTRKSTEIVPTNLDILALPAVTLGPLGSSSFRSQLYTCEEPAGSATYMIYNIERIRFDKKQ